MFSDEITSTDAFLDMPLSSQLLYFHLGMNADDDGFISSPKMVMRIISASSDDLKLLIAKKFLLSFESGVCVVKHWRINNYIRKDIYQETKYEREKSLLFIRPNGAYSFNSEGAVEVPKGHFTVPVDVTSTNRLRDVHLGKVRIGKVSKDNTKGIELPDWLDSSKWNEWIEYRKSRKLTNSPMTLKRQIAFLEKNKSNYIEIIEQSITNGWQGLFEKKGVPKKIDNVLITKETSNIADALKRKADQNK
jgi:hypothetical protein